MNSPNTYIDKRGWIYKVMGGIGTVYKARYQKPGTTKWKGLGAVKWVDSIEEAQRDLDLLVKSKGWVENK